MPTKSIVVAVLLLLCAAAGWLLLQGEGDLALPGQHETAAPVREVGPAAAADARAVEATAPATPAAETSARDAVAVHEALLPIPDDAKWIDVHVVDQASGEAVPGATVRWYDETITKALQERPALLGPNRSTIWRDQESIAARFGWQTTSDRHGVARVHQTESTEVVARHEGRYGRAQAGANLLPPRGGYRVEIAPDQELLVQVLDAAGAPAPGVPVAMAAHDAQGRFQYLRDWEALAITEAPDGIARLRHLQQLRAGEREAKVEQWRVRTHLPGFVDDGTVCTIDPPPPEPVVLRLPTCGSVRARAELHQKPVPEVEWITLYWQPARNQQRLRPEWGWGGMGMNWERPTDADGWARFPYVPLGAQFGAYAQALGGSLSRSFAGPVAAGAGVEVVLGPPDGVALLTGRLLDPQRVPFVQQKFRFTANGPQLGTQADLRTDAEGRFFVMVGRARQENRADLLQAEVRRDGQPTLIARAPGRELRVGLEDLGDLVLQLDALLVAGHFELDGAPCKRKVGLRIERFTAPERGGEPNWRQQRGLFVHQDEAGRFECRGGFPPGRYRLAVQSDQVLPREPIEFTPGALDLTVELRSGSQLAVTMLPPEGCQDEFVAELLGGPDSAGGKPKGRRSDAWRREDQRVQVQWPALPAGTYRLEVSVAGLPRPILQIADVAVPAPPGGDPRLVDIDLRALLRVQTVRLFDQDGKPIQDAEAALFPLGQDPDKELHGFPCWGGERRITVPPGPIDLLAAVRGFRPREVRATGEPLDVRLDPWPTVKLVFPDLPGLPEGCALQASLEPEPASTRRYRSGWGEGSLANLTAAPSQAQPIVQGAVTLPIGEGPHRVALHVRCKNARARVAFAGPIVLATAGSVALQVPAAALAKAAENAQALAKEREKQQQREQLQNR